MTCRILTRTGRVVSRSAVQRVASLEQQEKDTQEALVKLDVETHRRLKRDYRGHEGGPSGALDR